MIAKLPEVPKGDIKKTELYKTLFDTLIDRRYSPSGKLPLHESVLPKARLRLLVQEVAFAVFKSGKEYIHYEELLNSDLPQLKHFLSDGDKEKDKKNILRGLMMSFYTQERLREADDRFKSQALNSDYAIEFVHKSLQEYLAAEFIYESINQRLNTMFSDEYDFDAQKPERLLEKLSFIFAKQRLTDELVSNLIEIIDKKKSSGDEKIQKEVSIMAKRLAHCFSPLLAIDFLHTKWTDKLYGDNTSPIEQCANTFYG